MIAVFAWLCLLSGSVLSKEDSLRSAINAVQRRQRDLSPYYPTSYLLGNGQPEDIGYGYQKSVAPATMGVFDSVASPEENLGAREAWDRAALEKLLVDYLDQDDGRPAHQGKRSVFRENSNYPETLQGLYDNKEEGSFFRERTNGSPRLRNAHEFLRNFAGLNNQERGPIDEDSLSMLNSIWEKYRGEDPEDADEEDVRNIFDYLYPDHNNKRQYAGSYSSGYDFFNSPYTWSKREDMELLRESETPLASPRNQYRKVYFENPAFDDRYPYHGLDKRYPITKRSAGHRYRKNIRETDPKVAQEVSNIFSSQQKSNKTKNETTITTTKPVTVKTNKANVGQKELSSGNSLDKPLDIKKKSVKWSEYFGVDRRKKKSYPVANDDWLMNQYLQAYKGHDDKLKRKDSLDEKLQAMEDRILDEAIKYTGASSGTGDVERLREGVAARLTAAYSLERMRAALAELQASLARAPPTKSSQSIDKETKKPSPAHTEDKMEKKNTKELRTNEINTDSHHFARDAECPILEEIEEKCSLASSLATDKDMEFVPLCMLHNICYLCGTESGEVTPPGCDATFVSEASSMCKGNPVCRFKARLLLKILRSFRSDLSQTECDLRANTCLSRFIARLR